MNNNDEIDPIKPDLIPEVFDQMLPKKKKALIISMVEEEIKKQGAEGKLIFKPIENGYKANRKKYYSKSGVSIFEAYLSELNTLPLAYLEVETREVVSSAIRHFKLNIV